MAEQRVVRDAGPGRIGLAEVFRRTYEHDQAGQITEVEDSRWARGPAGPSPAVLAFGHDADGRLASSVLPDRGLAAYEADPAGNAPAAPVRLPRPPVTDGGAGAGSDLEDDPVEVGRVVAVRVAEGWALGYDADGNLLSKSDTSNRHGGVSWRYAYDAAGRLAEVWRDDGAGEIQVGAYGYDVLGRRVSRRTWALDGSGLEERVGWDGDVPAERRRSVRSAASSRTGDLEDASVRTYAFQGFEPVAVLDGLEDAAIIETDQVGQPRLAVDREGALVWEGRFDAWGADLEVGPLEDGGLEVEARFPGQVADAESGLRYNRFRYYDPGVRLYTREDTIGLTGGSRPHGYVGDPAWTDPYALACLKPDSGLPKGDLITAGHPRNAPYAIDSNGKWRDMNGRFSDGRWPPNDGFASRSPDVLGADPSKPDIISRYGGWVDGNGRFRDTGRYTSPDGTPFANRALRPDAAAKPFRRYQVMKPLPAEGGPAAPWFGQPGGGTQHYLPKSVEELVADGTLLPLP